MIRTISIFIRQKDMTTRWAGIFFITLFAVSSVGILHAQKSRLERARKNRYKAYRNIRAARVLLDKKFKGELRPAGQYLDAGMIRFDGNSNSLSLSFRGDSRQGTIISLGKSGARSGVYVIDTWKPQMYIGFESGPARKHYKTYRIKWRVRKLKSRGTSGLRLDLRVFGGRGFGTKGKRYRDYRLWKIFEDY